MNILHRELCPLCGSTRLKQIANCTDHYATGETFPLCECEQCGFRFTQDAPAEEEMGRYYESADYISHSDTNEGLMNKVYHHVRSFMLERKAKLVERASGRQRGDLLDIGAGTGYFAHTMEEHGWNVTAAEQNETARNYARHKFGLDMITPADMLQIEGQSFDVVTLWHVMEHVEHLSEEWDFIARVLRKNGRLIMATPNCASADARIYGSDWAAYDVPRHLWHFSPESMRQSAEAHGFRVIGVHPMPFDTYYVSMLSEKYRGHARSYFIRGMMNGLRANLSAMGNAERSSSIIYILKNK